jgi:formylglycine-generating enzyme required for sulfatase activity
MRSAKFMVAPIILDAMELVEVAAGWFWMGWSEGHPGERPRHRVWIDTFEIGRSPVTNREYACFLAATAAPPPPWWSDPRFADPHQPVVGVNWFEAVRYCEWLSTADGTPHRLPTEAEWEKAARGGLDGARYPWGGERPDVARVDRPPLVTATPANPLGLYGLSGVCHEWCLDWEGEAYYAASTERNPTGPPHGSRRVSRGGAWRHQDMWSPVAHRSSLPPELRYSDYGLRVVRVRSAESETVIT